MAKYDPLGDFLGKRRGCACTLTHANIEEILGAPLPPGANRDRAWWGNQSDGVNAQCRSWVGAGRLVDQGCQPERGPVRFVRAK